VKPGSGASSAADADTDPLGQTEAAARKPELITRLTRRRAASGLSQAGMAKLMGTSQPAVARFESGRHDAQLSTVRRYAGALGLSLDLVEGEASVDLPPRVDHPPLTTQTPADTGTKDWPGQKLEPGATGVVSRESGRPEPGHVLTWRQQKMLQVIRDSVQHRGYPPSLREIGEAVGLASASSVSYQLSTLQSKGYLRREAGRARTVGVWPLGQPTTPVDGEIGEDTATGTSPLETAYVPVMGRMAAGGLALADEGIEDFFSLPRQVVGEGNLFLLQVAGDCMSTHIEHGDWVAVRPQRDADDGDVVAAMFDGEAVVRVFRPSGSKVWLMPHDPSYPPIDASEASIMGRVVALLRQT
jgi:repressor LexA